MKTRLDKNYKSIHGNDAHLKTTSSTTWKENLPITATVTLWLSPGQESLQPSLSCALLVFTAYILVFDSIVERAEGIARELDASAERKTWPGGGGDLKLHSPPLRASRSLRALFLSRPQIVGWTLYRRAPRLSGSWPTPPLSVHKQW